MKTNQIMKRPFNNSEVSQRTADGFFNATELLKAFNAEKGKNKVLPEFWSNKNTIEFIEVLEDEILSQNIGNPLVLKTHQTTSGRNGGTWMHPYLFVKFAMWLSPEFEVKIIKWVYDNLIDARNQAGDHYKEMCEAIKDRYEQYFDKKADPLVYIQEANFLNTLAFGSPSGNQRNVASKEQLDLLNKLQLANVKMIKEGVGKADRRNHLRTFASLF